MRLSKIIVLPAYAASVCSAAALDPEKRHGSPCNAPDPVRSLLETQLRSIATSFCSSYLGYPRTATVTATATAATVTQTVKSAPPTVTVPATQNVMVTSTSTVTLTQNPDTVTVTSTVTAATKTVYAKRDHVERKERYILPPVLSAFAASKISSACSRIATATTKTITSTVGNTNTATVTTTQAAGYTVTVTQTVTISTTVPYTVTAQVTAEPATTTITTTVTPILVKPKICNAQGIPGPNAFNYDANFNTNQADCIASCKTDNRCLSTGFYIVTNPTTGSQTGTCRKYDNSVTDSADLGSGYYNFNDKAC